MKTTTQKLKIINIMNTKFDYLKFLHAVYFFFSNKTIKNHYLLINLARIIQRFFTICSPFDALLSFSLCKQDNDPLLKIQIWSGSTELLHQRGKLSNYIKHFEVRCRINCAFVTCSIRIFSYHILRVKKYELNGNQ